MLEVTINGATQSFAEPPLIRDILARLDIRPSAVAVEVNRTIVPRSAHGAKRLADGDVVEIVTFVGGG